MIPSIGHFGKGKTMGMENRSVVSRDMGKGRKGHKEISCGDG